MAIAFLRIRPISKAKGESSSNLRSYITRTNGWEAKANKDEIVIIHNSKPPHGFKNMNDFFALADKTERENGTTAKEIIIAIPADFNIEEAQELMLKIAGQYEKTRYLTAAIHYNKENPHIHLLLGERQRDDTQRDPSVFFKQYNKKDPTNSGSPKFENTSKSRRAFLATAREIVETETNKILERKNLELISFKNASEYSAPHLGAKLYNPMLKALAKKETDPSHNPTILKHPKVIRYLQYQDYKKELEDSKHFEQLAQKDRVTLASPSFKIKEKQSSNLNKMQQKLAAQQAQKALEKQMGIDALAAHIKKIDALEKQSKIIEQNKKAEAEKEKVIKPTPTLTPTLIDNEKRQAEIEQHAKLEIELKRELKELEDLEKAENLNAWAEKGIDVKTEITKNNDLKL